MLALLDEVAPEVILVVLLLVKSGNFLVQRSSGNGSSIFKLKDYQRFSLLGNIFFFKAKNSVISIRIPASITLIVNWKKKLPLKTLFVAGNE